MKAHIYSLDISCQKRWTFCSYFLCNHSVIWVSGWKLCVSKRILRAAETYCLTSRRVFWGPWLMSKSWISALRVVLFVESHAPRPYMWWNNKAIHRIIKIIALVKVCADHIWLVVEFRKDHVYLKRKLFIFYTAISCFPHIHLSVWGYGCGKSGILITAKSF